MSETNKKIFFLGATGYIGGSILVALVNKAKYQITTIIRNNSVTPQFRALGIEVIHGSFSDLEIIEKESSKADIVINAADCDNQPLVQAIFKGQKSRKNKDSIYIHTSGMVPTEKVIDDEDIKSYISKEAILPNEKVDAWIYENLNEEIQKVAIITPPSIFGIGTSLVRKTSMQIPLMISASIARGSSGWIGPRDDIIWSAVHILDLVDLYLLVLEGLEKGTFDHGKKGGLYFAITEDFKMKDLGVELGKSLKRNGLIETEDTKEFTEEELPKYFPIGQLELVKVVLGATSRGVSNRSKRLGWKPKQTTSILDSIEQDVQFVKNNK